MSSSFGVGDAGDSESPSAVMPSRLLVWSLLVLCTVALAVSGYLAWSALTMTEVAGCSAGDIIDCGHVLKSKWSKIVGVPVSVPAIGLYLSLISMLTFARRTAPMSFHRMLWNGITVGGLMAGCAALWFIGLQVFVLQHLCPWCLSVHACGLVIAAILVSRRGISLPRKSVLTSIASVSVAVMAAVQMLTPAPDNYSVERFDSTAVADAGGSVIDAEYTEFLPPGEEFSAPSDVFEAPGDIFEAPADDPEDSAAVSGAESSTDQKQSDSIAPAVTSTLLTILPMRFSLLSNLTFCSLQDSQPADESASGPPTTTDDATAATDATVSSTPSDGAVSPEEKKDEPRTVTVGKNRMTLKVEQWPMLGSAKAKYLFVEMFDYTCPHCRNTHQSIKGAMEHYGDDLAIVVLPVPLESGCNRVASGSGHPGSCELAKISLTVWRADKTKFHEFHNWIFDNHATPTSARKKAEEIVGKDKFAKVYGSKTPGEYIQRHVDLYEKCGKGSVPKLIFPKSIMSGEVGSKASLCKMIEDELGGTVQ